MIMKRLIKHVICRLTSSIKYSIIDEKAYISYLVRFHNSRIGKYSYISNNCNVFFAKIGKFTSISSGCIIGGGEHPLDWVSTSPAFHKNRVIENGIGELSYTPFKETIIGNDVWLGANVFVKSGVKISDGAVIGAGSVVVNDVPPYEIWGGNPAHKIKSRFDEDTKKKIHATEWWDLEDQELRKISNLFNDTDLFIEVVFGHNLDN